MRKIILIFFGWLIALTGDSQSYTCNMLDSLISSIELRREQYDFLNPLFYTGELKTAKGDSFIIATKDSIKQQKIKEVLKKFYIKEDWSLIHDDLLFHLDTFNVIVDSFRFFESTCEIGREGKRFVVVNDKRIIDHLNDSCNIIIVEHVSFSNVGELNLFVRNSKSEKIFWYRIRHASPIFRIYGVYYFDSETGTMMH